MRRFVAVIAVTALGIALAGRQWVRAGRSLGQPDSGSEGSEDVDPYRRALEAAVLRERELQLENASLRRKLARQVDRQQSREQEWLEFTRAISSLEVAGTPEAPEFVGGRVLRDLAAEVLRDTEAAAEASAAARAADLLRDLNSLLIAEQVLGLDVLEVGRVHDGWTGPVVVRLLDDRGRPTGSLAADRLRLELSRSGRSVTLIFEDGHETHMGQSVPFGPPSEAGSDRGGQRRMQLPGVDPEPWIELMPELVDTVVLVHTPDDGLWNPIELRLALDQLLRADTSSGHWRLAVVGGVVGGVLQDVQLLELDRNGRELRRLFADRMRIVIRGKGVELRLEDGVQVRAARTAPFLDGIYRLYLPRAKVAAWRAAGLPGLSRAKLERGPGDER